MKIILAIGFFLAMFFLSDGLRFNQGFLNVIMATLLGFTLGKLIDLQADFKRLRNILANDKLARLRAETKLEQENKVASSPVKESTDVHVGALDPSSSLNQLLPQNRESESSQVKAIDIESKPFDLIRNYQTGVADDTTSHKDTIFKEKPNKALSDSETFVPSVKEGLIADNRDTDSVFDKVIETVKGYFSGGNLFVRIGIIILFFGVSFLLKYVSDQGLFPIEYRLISVVIGAMVLLGLGWHLRHKNETYALLLQGAGIGVLYLDIYASFGLYHLLQPLAAFVLLFLVSMLSAALAVLQDSKSLAVLGFSGGFIAPVLASSGSNNHVGLFSYYAILNLAIVAVAWFKAWRPLNLLGFIFTFVIGTAWGVLSYNSSKFATTEPFLILFFLFYVLIAVLFALRQPPKLRGYVDGSLLFGVPLVASALQYSLVKDFEYGVSLSSFVMGAFYLILSWFIWKRKGDGLKLLAEALLALGVIFASMAIPFALAPTQTATAWALEGAGLLWLGSRQNRLSIRGFGLLLQLGAGLAFLSYYNTATFDTVLNMKPFINSEFMSAMMVAVAGIFSARLLIKPFEGRYAWEQSASPMVLVWGLIWLFGGFLYQFSNYYSMNSLATNTVILTALVSLVFTVLAIRSKPEWIHAWMVASMLFALVLILAPVQLITTSHYHPLQNTGWIAWPVEFAVYYFLLKKLEEHQVLQRFQGVVHSLLLLLLISLLTLEGKWILEKALSRSSDWLGIWYIIPTVVAMWLIIKAKFWPFSTHQSIYRQQAGVALAVVMVLWSFIALSSVGSAAPLPWLPVLNPLDIVSIIVFITLYRWWQTISNSFTLITNQGEQSKSFNKRIFAITIAGLCFLWLNFTLFRIAYHWFGIEYNAHAMYQSNLLQTAVSILWALSGVILTVYASRKHIRFLWLGGAVILGFVVMKLFVIDLSTLGKLTRIVSFLVVGILLTSIGYFAPLPEKDHETKNSDNTTKKHAKGLEENA